MKDMTHINDTVNQLNETAFLYPIIIETLYQKHGFVSLTLLTICINNDIVKIQEKKTEILDYLLKKVSDILDEQQDKSNQLKLDIKTKIFLYKYRLVPWILSCLAIILSVCSYFKPEKKQEQLLQKIELILPETKKNTLLQYDSLAKTLPKKTS
jgi:hypothetical protein